MNQDESLTCLKLSKDKFAEGDFEGSLRLAIKAQRMFESFETTEWLEKVRSSVENARANTQSSTEDNSTNVRQRHSVPVKEEAAAADTKEPVSGQTAKSDCNYTKEQVKEVKEFMKRNKEDYYAVLGIPKTATLDEIKKAYKKLALKFHPDKNQAPGADEAFKMISVAVSVLGDEEKRRNFDRFGASAGVSSGNGNGRGFASPFGAHFGHAGFEGEISPEELFNMFFNSAFAQHGHAQSFGAGPGQFFFSTNFHGHNPFQQQQRQARARRTSPAENENEELLRKFVQFIPLIIVFFLSIVSSWLFPGDNNNNNKYADTEHLFSLNPSGKYRHSRTTRTKQVPYYATERFQKYFSNLKDTDKTSKLARELASFEGIIENKLIGDLQKACEQEQRQLANMLKRAKKDQWDEIIDGFKLKSCDKLKVFEK